MDIFHLVVGVRLLALINKALYRYRVKAPTSVIKLISGTRSKYIRDRVTSKVLYLC